jgi:hypothetical protein
MLATRRTKKAGLFKTRLIGAKLDRASSRHTSGDTGWLGGISVYNSKRSTCSSSVVIGRDESNEPWPISYKPVCGPRGEARGISIPFRLAEGPEVFLIIQYKGVYRYLYAKSSVNRSE